LRAGMALFLLASAGLLSLAGPGSATSSSLSAEAQGMMNKAKADLARGDGLAAEVHLKQAQTAGAKREMIAARMGEAMLDQGKPDKAREWLSSGKFAADEAAHGFRMLGRLEHQQGNLLAAGQAYDKAIKLAPQDANLWIDVARLRYTGGEHMLAIEAADYALKLDPKNPDALLFRGQQVRDQYGLAAGLPWFKAALESAPNNLAVMGEYAATLGDLGQAKEMLEITRRMLQRDGKNARALMLQATLALRAGNASLARGLLNRTGNRLKDVPAKLLLDGVIELSSGNNVLAVEALERLLKLQPGNSTARDLMARALFAQGNFKVLVQRFGGMAGRSDASPYFLNTVARAYEVLGQREEAMPLLDRAARAQDRSFIPVPENNPVGSLLSSGRFGEAAASAERMRGANPGSADWQMAAGDAQLSLGRGAAAVERYNLAARVRLPESLLLRLAAAQSMAGQARVAVTRIEAYLVQSPSSHTAARMAASIAASQQDWRRAVELLSTVRDNGSGQDVRLLADLSLAQLRNGDENDAEASAREAYRRQPANAAATLAWSMALAKTKQRSQDTKALLDKAQALGANAALVAEARKLLVS
jgi:cellulose synthase operon protein C